MAKAIKHVTAGMLHIEVIGMMPERQIYPRRRGGRSRPTPQPQQFYNDKCSWRELELRLAANFGAKDMVLTFTFDDFNLPDSKPATRKFFYRFMKRLTRTRRRRGQEVKYICCVEGYHGKRHDALFGEDGGLEDRRFHVHAVINRVGPGDFDEIVSLWDGGGYIRAERLDVHYYRELAKYLTKEAREVGRGVKGEKVWSASTNLVKPTIEYIYIPSDSVTLTPPFGAVDYTQFSEKNPYGFADCIGARYLIFPELPKQTYSYNEGRKKNSH